MIQSPSKFAAHVPNRELKYADQVLKFPVRFSWGIPRKTEMRQGIFVTFGASKGPKFAKFPVSSLMIREFHAERAG
jgi:hypothetical protein